MRLMRAILLQAFYSIRSQRQLVERIDYDLLFRWFVGLGIKDLVWDATTFTKNRDRCWTARWRASCSPRCCRKTRVKRLLSSEHFSVNGTLLEAWASPKSCRPKDGSGEPPGPGRNGERDFHGERRRNAGWTARLTASDVPTWVDTTTAMETVLMHAITIGLDIAKSVFQVHGEDPAGKVVLQKRLRRGRWRRFLPTRAGAGPGSRRAAARINSAPQCLETRSAKPIGASGQPTAHNRPDT